MNKLSDIFKENDDLLPQHLGDLMNGTLSGVNPAVLSRVNGRLAELVPADMETVEIIGWLSVTHKVWKELPARKAFVLASLRAIASRERLVKGLVWNLVPEYPEYNSYQPAEWHDPEEADATT